MSADFHTQAHAKCILAGEHAVLRGHSALVFPVQSKSLQFSYWKTEQPLQVDFNLPLGKDMISIFWNVLNKALSLLQRENEVIRGHCKFENNIHIGAGLGFSAAFCICVARWMQWQGWLAEAELFNFARELENHFHGRSSGLDIVGAMSEGGMHFTMPQVMRPVTIKWRPQLYLSHSGQVSITAQCIQRVKMLWESDPVLAKQVDENMAHSVSLMEQALTTSEAQGLPLLKEAMELADNCFAQWHLRSSTMQRHAEQLLSAGALVCKPTGAGGGGYMLSLWDKKPETPTLELTAVF